MKTDREVMQMALDALGMTIFRTKLCTAENIAALDALRKALERPEPTASFDDPDVQAVYEVLCDTSDRPPKEQHWEGWVARRIVDALARPEQEPVAAPAAVAKRDSQFGGSSYEASMLRNLLARIHGDGGHYVAQHGLDKALEDADSMVAYWRAAPISAQSQDALNDAVRKFSEWLDYNRRNPVSEIFRDLVEKYRAALASQAKQRCELCGYEHAIGCENNPVDIALKAKQGDSK